MHPDVWIFAGSHAEANHFARATGMSPAEWLFVRSSEVLRGRIYTADTHIVWLSGFDQRSDRAAIEQELAVISIVSVGQPSVEDRRLTVPDELLRSMPALMAWLDA